jgi:riboflavin biosynthesis pyrimidine reductase
MASRAPWPRRTRWQATGRFPIGGGARLIQQSLAADLVDEIWLHIAPVLLGAGMRLFDHLGEGVPRLDILKLVPSLQATHIHYRLHRQ